MAKKSVKRKRNNKVVNNRNNSRRVNKRGAEMTIGTIIVIILALVVLVVVIYGFTTGWGNLWQRITGFAPKANIQTVVQSCQLACGQQAVYDYCKYRNVTFSENDKNPQSYNCEDLVRARGASVGLESCPAISGCTSNLPGKLCGPGGWGGSWSSGVCVGSGQVWVANTLLLSAEANLPTYAGQHCCVARTSCLSIPTNAIWVTSDMTCSSISKYDVTSLVIDTDLANPQNIGKACCAS
jgi:hypothetical protein